MNKGLLIALTGVLMGVQAGVAHAVNPDNGPGCGLGKLAWADYKTPKNIAPQVMMATTNGTFGSQTFGISFGTSGCTNDGKVMAGQQTNVFVAGAFESLSEDMARGGGEHLATLATLMGVPSEQQSTFLALAVAAQLPQPCARCAGRTAAHIFCAGSASVCRACWGR